ncbi:MAG: glutamate/aspartate ABC transporter substrate-binding protein [Deltaproteobacteria bacterium]|nr:glutamate/aspartate ABC transporter substrate-binding protein [Deltaproteobacteria bacterium]
MKNKIWKTLAALAGLALFLGGFVQAQQLTDTLSRIKNDGQVIVGHRESSVPFSYYDSHQNIIGYSQDYSALIVAAIKKELRLPDLAVKLVPLTSQNRIPLLRNGSYDFECGSTTNNLERQKQVGFSNTIFVVSTRLLTAQDSGINDFEDLQGKTVVVTSGTTSEKMLFTMNEANNMSMNIISAKDHGDSFRTVESGRAAAFFIDDAILAGERAKAKNPKDWVIVGTPQSYEAYGCMLRKGDTRFKKLLDDVIAQAQTSDAALWSYDNWFMNPIPPNNVNLEFEMSNAMKQLFAHPNDRAFQ